MEKISLLLISDIHVDLISKNVFGLPINETVVNTPFGASEKIFIFAIDDLRVGYLSRHGEKDSPLPAQLINYKANIYAGKELGTERILSWNSIRPINKILEPGDLIVPDGFIDVTKRRDYTFYNNKGFGFVKQNPAFCPELRRELIKQARIYEERSFDVGIYFCVDDPQLKTESEISIFRQWGGDLLGSTLTPEIYLEKELAMCYASICFVDCLPENRERKHKELGEILANLTRDVIKHLSFKRNCSCAKTMESYKLRGDIGEDWHEWVRP